MKKQIQSIGKKVLIGAIIARGLVGVIQDVVPNKDVPQFRDMYIADVYGNLKPEVIMEGTNGNTYVYTQDQENWNYVLAKDKIRENYIQESNKVRSQIKLEVNKVLSESYKKEEQAANVGFGNFDDRALREVQSIKAQRTIDLSKLGNQEDSQIDQLKAEESSKIKELERRITLYKSKK